VELPRFLVRSFHSSLTFGSFGDVLDLVARDGKRRQHGEAGRGSFGTSTTVPEQALVRNRPGATAASV
jgi:hypothetical protein